MGKRGPKPRPEIAERDLRIVEQIRAGATLADLAQEYGLAERYIYRICRRLTGASPTELQKPRWTRESVLHVLRQWMERNGRPPMSRDLRVAEGLPAYQTVKEVLELDSWRQVYAILGVQPPSGPMQRIVADVTLGPPSPDEIRAARDRLNLSRSAFAAMLGISEGDVEQLERGTRRAQPYLRLALAFLERR